ncbi:MAG: hypothetical protein P8129_22870 [Anaerolineae bacterium]
MFGIEGRRCASAWLSLVAVLVALCLAVIVAPSRSTAGPPLAGQDAPLAVRLPAATYAALRAELAGLETSSIQDYGAFIWLETTAGGLAGLEAADPSLADSAMQVYRDPFVLHLGGRAFDPLRQGAALPVDWAAAGGDGADLRDGADLHLVQFVGPIRSAWLDTLQKEGLEIVQYIPPFTYVVWGDAKTLAQATAASDEVRC